MAGHSKWANIKHRKGAADARRSKLFSKLAKYIMVAARNGGANPAENLRLRYAIDRAKAESMPKDSIERAVKKGSGELLGDELVELTYEGIGPGGVSLIVEVLTDNRNRTGGEIRNVLEKRGGSLGKSNSVLWKFDRRGVLSVSKTDASEEAIFEAALEAGAENIEDDGDVFTVQATLESLEPVRAALSQLVERNRGIGSEKKWGESEDDRPIFTRNELSYLPQTSVQVTDLEKARQLLTLMNDLEDHEDVQNVHSDFDVPEDLLATLSKEG
jgi:YebC/PmpR family DNA-binding regulatory protein